MAQKCIGIDFGSGSLCVFCEIIHTDFTSFFAESWIEDYAKVRIRELMKEYASQYTVIVPYTSREKKLESGMMRLYRSVRNILSSDISTRIFDIIQTCLNLINNPIDTILSSPDYLFFSIESQDVALDYMSESDICTDYISSQTWRQNCLLWNDSENIICRWQLQSYIFRISVFQSFLNPKVERKSEQFQKSVSFLEYAQSVLYSGQQEKMNPMLKTKIQPDVCRAGISDIGKCGKQRQLAIA